MGTGYIRQSAADIVDTEDIVAAPLNAEFNQLRDAFNGTTGHSHDGTTGEGPLIDLTTSITGVLPVANGGIAGVNKTNATAAPTVNDDSDDGYAVGSIWSDVTNDNTYICIDASVGAAIWSLIGPSTGVQPLDAQLTLLATLSPGVGNSIPMFTSNSTITLEIPSDYGLDVLEATDFDDILTSDGMTVTKAELESLHGLTSTVTELNYLDGASGDIQAQINGKQDADVALNEVVNVANTGAGIICVKTADNTVQIRTLTGPAAGITVTNGDGNSGNPTLALAHDLAALEALGSTGIAARTGSNTWAQRTITGTSNEISVSNGDGVSGNPTLSLPSALTLTGKTITGGTYTNPLLSMFIGTVFDFAGTSAPSGFLMCYGQAVSRTTYSALYSAIGTTHGVGDGSTTFNLPDLRGRVVAGTDNMGGTSANRLTDQSGGLDGDTLGDTGGSETHILTEAELATHDHTITDSGHTHTVTGGVRKYNSSGSGEQPWVVDGSPGYATESWSVNSATTGITVNNAGSGNAHNNVQPTIILNKMIFTGVFS